MKKERDVLIRNAVNLGLYTNIVLAVVKIFTGIIGQSQALIADGINSTSDVVYYIFVKIFTKKASKPADSEHPYGHRQMESIAALVIGAFVITTGVAIFWDSVNSVYQILVSDIESQKNTQIFTLGTALGTIFIKLVLFYYTRGVGKKTGNAAVVALSCDHRNDIVASFGVAVGITAKLAGLSWADPLAGALVALIVLKTGVEILQESSNELMDTVPGETLNNEIRIFVKRIDGVRTIEELRAHRFGPFLVVNITIGVDGDISIKKGDIIATNVENILIENIDLLQKVYVHYHPFSESLQQIE